jgi:hypothetical protein
MKTGYSRSTLFIGGVESRVARAARNVGGASAFRETALVIEVKNLPRKS